MARAKKQRSRQEQTLEKITNALAPFRSSNPEATIEYNLGAAGYETIISKPWGDPSVAFVVTENSSDLISALNNVILPSRYSAIWHSDEKALEIIWTAFKQPDDLRIAGREFKFKFNNKLYECSFSKSSDRLLVMAKHVRPVAASETSYRNLQSFNYFVGYPPSTMQFIGEPLSFWIKPIDWDEDEVLALALQLNFYLRYYDQRSPVIIIHPPRRESTTVDPPRYRTGSFPKNIQARDVDLNLLFLWEAARIGDNARRFLYYYRIIEYACAYYLDSTARTALRIALAAPNALDDLASLSEAVVIAVRKMKADEYAAYEGMIRDLITPKLLWESIQLNLSAFTAETTFEGGFRIAPLLTADRNEGSYTVQDVQAFAKTIRDIRNALSHGRDLKTAGLIAPTVNNFLKLHPWIGPISTIASQVILFKSVY